MTTPEKIWWSAMAGFGVLVPAGILNLRQRVMCPTLELKAFDFLPLSGAVHGYNPHLLYRIMHDLTHPIVLLGYAVVLAGLGLWPILGKISERASRFLSYALLLFHIAFFAAYFGSMFLRIGDMVDIISPIR